CEVINNNYRYTKKSLNIKNVFVKLIKFNKKVLKLKTFDIPANKFKSFLENSFSIGFNKIPFNFKLNLINNFGAINYNYNNKLLIKFNYTNLNYINLSFF